MQIKTHLEFNVNKKYNLNYFYHVFSDKNVLLQHP